LGCLEIGGVIYPDAAGPEVENAVVSFVYGLEISEPDGVFVVLASVADVAGPLASVCIALAFDILVPVSVFAVEVYSSRRPRFRAFPNSDYYASSSSSAEVVREESVYNATGVRTNYGLCSTPSNPDPHHNKNVGHNYNKPSPGRNIVSDTNDLPTDATTSHSRKICLHL
jgi:hypothetical protein